MRKVGPQNPSMTSDMTYNSLITNTAAQRMAVKTRRKGMLYHVATRQTFRGSRTDPGHGNMTA
jgi:hypothetical protein